MGKNSIRDVLERIFKNESLFRKTWNNVVLSWLSTKEMVSNLWELLLNKEV